MATAEERDHRRPDITCYHPGKGGQRLVFDVTICWREEQGLVRTGRRPGDGARAKERVKDGRYEEALARVVKEHKAARARGVEWTPEDAWTSADRFEPLGFENGAWGPASWGLLRRRCYGRWPNSRTRTGMPSSTAGRRWITLHTQLLTPGVTVHLLSEL